MASSNVARSKWRVAFRWGVRILGGVALLLLIAFVFVFRNALYHRYVTFPKQAHAWKEIQAQRQTPALDDGWEDHRGVCHSHSELSHDSNVPFPDILAALKKTGRDFICMSDHCNEGKGDYSLQWRGTKEGVVFVPGYEMSEGFMPWGIPPDVTLPCGGDVDVLAKQIADLGGLLFFAHTEEPRRWDLPQLVGMEIYNIHTDFKGEGFGPLLPDLLLNLGAYPDQTLRLIFDRQTAILEHWDELNIGRKIVGIAANDCHQNNGFVGRYTERGTLLVDSTSGENIGDYELNVFTRLVLRVLLGPLEPGKQLFRWEVDPYERSVRFVSTHVLVKELTEDTLLDALRNGRVYVSFDELADATGFVWMAESGGAQAVMGETIAFGTGVKLRAAAPCPCRFTVLRHGIRAHQEEGREIAWTTSEPGKYRVEAELNILGEWTPWVYSNPIEIK